MTADFRADSRLMLQAEFRHTWRWLCYWLGIINVGAILQYVNSKVCVCLCKREMSDGSFWPRGQICGTPSQCRILGHAAAHLFWHSQCSTHTPTLLFAVDNNHRTQLIKSETASTLLVTCAERAARRESYILVSCWCLGAHCNRTVFHLHSSAGTQQIPRCVLACVQQESCWRWRPRTPLNAFHGPALTSLWHRQNYCRADFSSL